MIIKRIQIDGFGSIDNKIFDLSKDRFQVIYGENEAGKSTLRLFIQWVLFGFLARSQLIKRVEPKKLNRFGGRITLQIDEQKEFVVERMSQKGREEVKVHLSDGTVQNELYLKSLLKGIDLSMFESVFSFDLDGLQAIEKIQPQELDHYLLSAGMLGSQELTHLEKNIDKELDDLFKPNGRKPILNQKLNKLENIHSRVLHSKEKEDHYQKLIENRKTLDIKIFQLDEDVELLQKEKQYLKKLEQIQPFVEELDTYEEQLSHINTIETFPEDGLERIKELENHLLPIKAEYATLKNRETALTDALRSLKETVNWKSKEANIEELLEQKLVFSKYKEKEIELSQRIENKNFKIEQMRQQLGLVNDRCMKEIDINISYKEKVKDLSKRYIDHLLQKKYLDDTFQKIKDELEEHELEAATLDKQRLSEEERYELEKRYEQNHTIEVWEKHKTRLLNKINKNTENEKKIKAQTNKKTRLILLFLFVCLIGVAGWFFFNNQVELSVAACIFFFILGTIVWKNNNYVANQLIKELHAEKSLLSNEYDEIISDELLNQKPDHSAIEKLTIDQTIRQQLEQEQLLISQLQKKFHSTIKKFEGWEEGLYNLNQDIKAICKDLSLPDSITGERLKEAYELLESLKRTEMEKERFQTEINQVQEECIRYVNGVKRMAKYLGLKEEENIEILLRAIKQFLLSERQKDTQKEQIEKELGSVRKDISDTQEAIKTYENYMNGLFIAAKVENKEQFLKNGNDWERSRLLQNTIQELSSKIKVMLKGIPVEKARKDLDNSLQSILTAIQNIDKDIRKREEERHFLLAQIADINAEVRQLEQAGIYSEVRHELEYKKEDFKKVAKQWATYQIAKAVLKDTKEKYRNERLPKVIELAQSFFYRMTNGRYVKLYPPTDSNSIIVERLDGVRFQPSDLSRATAEQLYLSMRFALVMTYKKSGVDFPVIVDDSFVNFDRNRRELAIRVLQEISQSHQIVFFTCHKTITDHFKDGQIINLVNS